MNIRILALAASLIVLALAWSCSRGRMRPQATQPAAIAGPELAPRGAAPVPPPRTDMPDTALQAAQLRAAADVVQRYLALAGGADYARADRLWARNRTPQPHHEAGLRTVWPARAMQVRTGTPVFVEPGAAGTYVDVPVKLRVDGRAGGQLRFAGRYRVRHDDVAGRWELVAADLAPELR